MLSLLDEYNDDEFFFSRLELTAEDNMTSCLMDPRKCFGDEEDKLWNEESLSSVSSIEPSFADLVGWRSGMPSEKTMPWLSAILLLMFLRICATAASVFLATADEVADEEMDEVDEGEGFMAKARSMGLEVISKTFPAVSLSWFWPCCSQRN